MSWDVRHRCSSDLELLWLWHRLAATALIHPLVLFHWCGPKKKKKKKKKKRIDREQGRKKTEVNCSRPQATAPKRLTTANCVHPWRNSGSFTPSLMVFFYPSARQDTLAPFSEVHLAPCLFPWESGTAACKFWIRTWCGPSWWLYVHFDFTSHFLLLVNSFSSIL